MFEQTFLYFQLEILLFLVMGNIEIESIAHFIRGGLLLQLSVCLSSLYNKNINSCYTAWLHATNVFLHLFVCFKTWPSLNLKAVSPHHKTPSTSQLVNAQKMQADFYVSRSKT